MGEPINTFPEYELRWERDAKGQLRACNIYRDVDVGRGGYVYAEPGMYTDIALLDSASHHPTSAINLNYFGEYTPRFKQLLDARLHIKHGEFEEAAKMFDGKLEKYLNDPKEADALAYALKIAINSVYGLTSASFANPFVHKDNKNNIVALRGALFMKLLQDEVKQMGFSVIHVKTDSCKIPNATPEIIQFVFDFGKKYGYTFEHEATYDRMCLVNDSVYIAKYADADWCQKKYGYIPEKNAKKGGQWTPTGAQFAQPFVYKTLFTKESIEFKDLCETKSVSGSAEMYLDYNESLPDVSAYEKELAERLKPDETKSKRPSPLLSHLSDDDIRSEIAKGHDYKFVGKVGLFTPVVSGIGAADLVVARNGKYSSVTGAKGYRWLESERVKELGYEDRVDLSYYRKLVDDAIDAISKYGDFNWFVSDDISADFPPNDNDVPWLMPCKDPTKTVCEDCPEYQTCKYLKGDVA